MRHSRLVDHRFLLAAVALLVALRTAQNGRAVFVVPFSLRGVGEHFEGVVDFLEPFLGSLPFVYGVLVRVVLERRLAVRLPERVVVDVDGHAEHLVEAAHRGDK